MMIINGHKLKSAKNMIIELGLVFQNLKLANERIVNEIGTRWTWRT